MRALLIALVCLMSAHAAPAVDYRNPMQPNWLGVVQTGSVRRITWSSAGAQVAGPELQGDSLQFRQKATGDEMVSYEYCVDDGQD